MRVKIQTDENGRARASNAATGQALWAKSIVTHADVNNPFPRAIIELVSVEIEYDCDAQFVLIHPITGLKQTVRRIEFADGSVLDLEQR